MLFSQTVLLSLSSFSNFQVSQQWQLAVFSSVRACQQICFHKIATTSSSLANLAHLQMCDFRRTQRHWTSLKCGICFSFLFTHQLAIAPASAEKFDSVSAIHVPSSGPAELQRLLQFSIHNSTYTNSRCVRCS